MKRLIPALLVLVVLGFGLVACSGPLGQGNFSRAAVGNIVWNGEDDKAVAVDIEATASLKSNASGAKITSNSSSAAFPGVFFIWDAKQKDSGYLKVDSSLFVDKYVNFTLTWKEGSNYFDAIIQPVSGQEVTDDGCYVFFIPSAAGNKSINMVFIGDFLTLRVAMPTATIQAGTYLGGTEIVLETATEDAIIYYTIDGSDPTADSIEYTGPIFIEETFTLKAIAVKEGLITSGVYEATYTLSGITTATLQRKTFLNTLINQADFPQSAGPVVGTSGFLGNYRPDQSWDCYGWGDNGKLYFGWTTYNGRARRPNSVATSQSRGGSSQEDFLIFSYDPATDEFKYIDSFMETSRRQGNLRWHDGSDPSLPHSEETPKGHTKFLNIGDGYIYMASQPFHDWKNQLTSSDAVFPFPISDFRGGKIFRLDPFTDTLVDLSATMANTPAPGVTTEHEGIIAIDYMPSLGLIVGWTHPYGNLVFVDPVANAVVRYVVGMPNRMDGSNVVTVSRDIVVDDLRQKVYMYRGREANDGVNRPVYVYDWATDTVSNTGSSVSGGMWGTAVVDPNGRYAYCTHLNGNLTRIDLEAGTAMRLGALNPAGATVGQIYFIIPSPDWTKLYSVPALLNNANNGLWEFNLLNNTSRMVYPIGTGNTNSNVYTSQKDLLKDGKLYVMSAGAQNSTGSWNSSNANLATNAGACILFVFDLEFNQ